MLRYHRHFVPTDQDLTFYVCTYHDLELLDGCLTHLRLIYPESRVIVVSDGDINSEITIITQKHGADFHKGEWLYALSHGGKRHQRMLDLFFKNPSRFLVKIDTDTRIVRRFEQPFKDAPCVFGKLISKDDWTFIQGGCIIYHIKAAQKLHESQEFLSQEIIEDPHCWSKFEAAFWKIENGYISEDQISAYVTSKLGIKMSNHPEVCSLSSDYAGIEAAKVILEERPSHVAVLHPVKSKMTVW